MNDLERTILFPALRDERSGRYAPLADGSNSLGRAADSTLCFDDATISRRHCTIELKGGIATLRAESGHNPTYLNGSAIASSSVLRHRDQIRIGERTLVFMTSPNAAPPPPAADGMATVIEAKQPASTRTPPPPGLSPNADPNTWNVARPGNGQEGPYSLERLRSMVRSGEVAIDQLVRRASDADWKFVGSLPEFAGLRSAPAGTDHPGSPELAPLLPRFIASFIDHTIVNFALVILLLLVVGTLSVALGPALSESETTLLILSLCCSALVVVVPLYFALLDSTLGGATIGKRICGLRVTDLQGRPLGVGKATIRAVARCLCVMPMCIGAIPVLFTPARQGLHDLACQTLVVRARRR